VRHNLKEYCTDKEQNKYPLPLTSLHILNLNCIAMKIKLLLCLLLTVLSATAFAQLPRVSVEGNHFVDPNGKTIVFRGLCASDPDKLSKGEHWNKDYFATAKSWGANIIRLPVHPAAWRSQGQERYLKLLDQGVAWAAEQGIYVIIDWHSIGNLRTELFQTGFSPLHLTEHQYDTTLKETFEFWRLMAKRYGTNSETDRATIPVPCLSGAFPGLAGDGLCGVGHRRSRAQCGAASGHRHGR